MYVNQDLRHKDHNQHKDLQCKNQERDKYSCRKDKDQDQDFSLMTSTRYDNTNNIRTLHHLIWQKTANSLPLLTASSCDRRQPTHYRLMSWRSFLCCRRPKNLEHQYIWAISSKTHLFVTTWLLTAASAIVTVVFTRRIYITILTYLYFNRNVDIYQCSFCQERSE